MCMVADGCPRGYPCIEHGIQGAILPSASLSTQSTDNRDLHRKTVRKRGETTRSLPRRKEYQRSDHKGKTLSRRHSDKKREET